MKKITIYIIILILIFLISVYIGLNIDTSNEETEQEMDIELEENNVGAVIGRPHSEEIEQTASEDEINKEHYVLREVGQYVKVYSIDDDEKEELYLSTDIAIEYLPETDKASLKKGIHVYSKNELNEILQDFE